MLFFQPFQSFWGNNWPKVASILLKFVLIVFFLVFAWLLLHHGVVGGKFEFLNLGEVAAVEQLGLVILE